MVFRPIYVFGHDCHVHTVECFFEGQRVGGLYGLVLGRVFFGESMFHLKRDASKVALAHLIARLIAGGFVLLDTQFVTPHLASMGAIAVPKSQYQELLHDALEGTANFHVWPSGTKEDAGQALRLLQSTDR